MKRLIGTGAKRVYINSYVRVDRQSRARGERHRNEERKRERERDRKIKRWWSRPAVCLPFLLADGVRVSV